jgi:hypothetical protein
MKWLVVVAAAGCFGSSKTTPPLSNTTSAPARPTEWRMSVAGLAPLGAGTEATEAGLRAALHAVTVKMNDLGGESGIVFDVLDGAERLFYVVPDEEPHDSGERRYATTIFSIFATSPRVRVEGYTWRVGAPLDSADGLTACECWGDGEVTACSTGANLSVIFEERCEPAESGGPAAMIGRPIGRIMWKRIVAD